ncbi:MAG: alkyl hydroperoxide reductase [Gammaproteobacteria bacterium SG8_47]|nr:MAG: alkyl hydroperoxide reductase [Gammaproteobacteria bacterium SG8_47]
MLQAGQSAPSFNLPDALGTRVQLSDFSGDKTVVLYFYPKDDTPGCTIEANDFTRMAADFAAANTVVLGVSRDSCDSHAAFVAKYGLNVRLLSDADGTVCEDYGVWQEKERDGKKSMGIVRSTFIISTRGEIKHALYGVNAEGHAAQVLDMVKGLASSSE